MTAQTALAAEIAQNEPFTHLLASLDQELAAYRELLALSHDKGRHIVGGELDALNRVVERELELLARLDRIEGNRANASAALAVGFGLPAQSAWQALAAQLPDADREALRERRRALLLVMDEVARLNAANETLLRQSLSYVEFSLSLFKRAGGHGPGYQADGRIPTDATLPRWQRRA